MDDTPEQPCPFCAIAAGTAPAHRVYADCDVTAFLDKNPINSGHLLVVPNRHVADVYDLDQETFVQVMLVVRRLAAAVKSVTHPRKVGLVVAGFDVPHAHVHLIPMHEYHDITSKKMLEGTRTRPSDGDLAASAEAMIAALA